MTVAGLVSHLRWTEHVTKMYASMLMRKAKSWFTGYNSNVPGHEHGKIRYFVYNGGAPRFWRKLRDYFTRHLLDEKPPVLPLPEPAPAMPAIGATTK